jgi:hypothetical protein
VRGETGGPGGELEEAETWLAVWELKQRYRRLVDDRFSYPAGSTELDEHCARIAALFTEDAVWDGGPGLGRIAGRRAIAQRLARPTIQAGCHFFFEPTVTVTPGQARATWRLVSPCIGQDGRGWWMRGVERDEYVRSADGWLQSSMCLVDPELTPADPTWIRSVVRRGGGAGHRPERPPVDGGTR